MNSGPPPQRPPAVPAPHRPGGAPHGVAPHGVAPHGGAPHGGAPHGGAPHDGTPQDSRPPGPLLHEVSPPYKRRSGRIAAVMLYRNGGHRVMWPDRKEDHGTPVFGGPYTVFEVLLGRNVTEFSLELPASGDGVFFQARAAVQWEVDDPHLVVTRQVWDVAELLRDDLLDGLRAVSRRFGITEAQRADEAVRDELAAGRLQLGRDLGLRTRVLVFFDLDTAVQDQLAEADRTLVGMGVDRRVAERERRKEAYDRQLVADRAREMQVMLQQGEIAQIAHHMAANPDKQWEIRRQLRAEEREGKADFLAVLHRLIDTGVIERHDLDQMTYQVLEHLRSSSGGVLGGVADRVLDVPGPQPRALTDGTPRGEPVRPPWEEEPADGRAADAGPDGNRVHEPTRVQSARERDRERERERGRGRDGDGGAPGWDDDGVRNPDAGRHADHAGYDDRRYDDRRYDDRSYDDRRHDGRRHGESARPSADFDDWDDE
ncbi:hypothetical protein [Streptomyces sp. TRM49041]|uniref:hypothetical protein n=1 Tax=Streptomyces sp. TRM49041 TaxID=2603216 RepID=UPI00165688BB|nr:hypothetical protein [Streptomyces sp. TRM49041]